jgi:hypothetical protein
MDLDQIAKDDLIKNDFYKERDVYTEGFAPQSVPYVEQELIEAYKLGYEMAMRHVQEKL